MVRAWDCNSRGCWFDSSWSDFYQRPYSFIFILSSKRSNMQGRHRWNYDKRRNINLIRIIFGVLSFRVWFWWLRGKQGVKISSWLIYSWSYLRPIPGVSTVPWRSFWGRSLCSRLSWKVDRSRRFSTFLSSLSGRCKSRPADSGCIPDIWVWKVPVQGRIGPGACFWPRGLPL